MITPPWEILWRALKGTYKYGRAKAFGATVTLIGPPGSGKTQIFNYMKTNKLNRETAHISSIRAETDSSVKYVGDKDNYLEVLDITDTTGQDSKTAGADAIGISKPAVVIIVLDGQADLQKQKEYAKEVIERIAGFDDRVLKGIKVVAIFLNKFDKASDSEASHENAQALLKVAKSAGGSLANKCIVCETVFVKTEGFGSSLAEQAFQDIKNAMKKA